MDLGLVTDGNFGASQPQESSYPQIKKNVEAQGDAVIPGRHQVHESRGAVQHLGLFDVQGALPQTPIAVDQPAQEQGAVVG